MYTLSRFFPLSNKRTDSSPVQGSASRDEELPFYRRRRQLSSQRTQHRSLAGSRHRPSYRRLPSRAVHRYSTRPRSRKDPRNVILIAVPQIFAAIRYGLSTYLTHKSPNYRSLVVGIIVSATPSIVLRAVGRSHEIHVSRNPVIESRGTALKSYG